MSNDHSPHKNERREPKGRRATLADILLKQNRGILLDIVVFIVSAFLMQMLMTQVLKIARAAYNGDLAATVAVFLYSLSFLVLAPVGAFLKRWHFHQRKAESGEIEPNGCLFNPLIYYCVMVVIYSIINALVFQYFFGDDRDEQGGLFVGSIIFGMIAVAIHTWLVYRYFSPPDRIPRTAFMRGPMSETIGDICIFVNMLFFQIIWNVISSAFTRPMVFWDIVGNLIALLFGSIILYFPPRMIYLAEDIKKRRTWFFILLANSPLIYHAIFGGGHRLHF